VKPGSTEEAEERQPVDVRMVRLILRCMFEWMREALEEYLDGAPYLT
jgi:hypothetical protein